MRFGALKKDIQMRMDPCKSSLSAPRQDLLQIMRRNPFSIIEIEITQGQPRLHPPPKITREVKLGIDVTPPPSFDDRDFALKKQVADLFDHFDRLRDGSVVTIEVRHGLPSRLILAGEV